MFFYEFDNETELLIYRSLQIKIKYQTFLYFISDQTDQTELEIVNFINICSENWFVYVAMSTDFFINKDVSKTDETLHDECNFTENKIWDASCCILFQSCDWTESESVNIIKISDEKWNFM